MLYTIAIRFMWSINITLNDTFVKELGKESRCVGS